MIARVRRAVALLTLSSTRRKGRPVFGTLGWQELLIILVILALLVGASRVADLGGALGRGIREFRTEARGDDEEDGSDSDGAAASSSDSSSSNDDSRDDSGGG